MNKFKIIYEDSDLLVLFKPAGLAVQSASPSVPDLKSRLLNEFAERGEKQAEIYLIHRLDQPVEGLLVVGKNQKAAASLSRQAAAHKDMEKWYQALITGRLPDKDGVLEDYLIFDGRKNISRVGGPREPGAKKSQLCYHVLKDWEENSLLQIRLLTGRHHQIRVQLAHAGVPIVGDRKYGSVSEGGPRQLALCATKLTFLHPRTGKPMSFRAGPTFPVPPTVL